VKLLPTAIEGVVVVETSPVSDGRGEFTRLYCDIELGSILHKRRIVQINKSTTRALGAVRGLHYQRHPNAELKLIRCLKGAVFDVAVDLRARSPTFLKWHGERLTAANHRMLVVPEGCAHGFQVLEPDSELLYLHTARYAPDAEGGVRYDDPSIAIRWPMPAADISNRDSTLPLVTHDSVGTHA